MALENLLLRKMDNLEKVLERMGTTDNLTWALRVPPHLCSYRSHRNISQSIVLFAERYADEVSSAAMLHF